MRATRDVVAGMDSSRDVVAPKVCRPCKKAGRSGFVCRRCGIPCCEHYCSYKEAPSHRAAMIPATCSACLLSPSKQAASSSKRSQAESVHARRVADRLAEATGRKAKPEKNDVSGRDVVVLGSGNLGLVYLMEEEGRMSVEQLSARHPELLPALAEHPHIGWVLARSEEHGAVVLGGAGMRYLEEGRIEGQDPLERFTPTAAQHLLRTHGFAHAPDLLIGSFYDSALDEGCAFEELISFHGGLGGPQTRPFLLYPAELPPPAEQVVGAEELHRVLAGWRRLLDGDSPALAQPALAARQQ